MSGAGPRGPTRRLGAAAFGAAGLAAFVCTGALAALVLTQSAGEALTVARDALFSEASWLAPVAASAVAGGAGAGWLRAGTLWRGGPWRHATWGGGVALLGCLLSAVLLGVGYAGLLAYDGWTYEAETGSPPAYSPFTLVGVVGTAVGAPLVLVPAALGVGAVTGWLLGRLAGTAAPPAR